MEGDSVVIAFFACGTSAKAGIVSYCIFNN